jgi:hypothetical protein
VSETSAGTGLDVEAEVRWGITDETFIAVRDAMLVAIERQGERCGESGCTCDLNGTDCAKYYRDALYVLESGCHLLAKIPA